MYFLGYDIGSSSIKASLLDAETNEVLYSAQHPKKEMSISSPHPGWAEQDPEQWWSSIVKVTHEIFSQPSLHAERLKAIGISYQMHGLVLVNKEFKVLRPSIIWCDSRAVNLGQLALEKLGNDFCLHSLLNSPGNFTAAKLAWVKENEPEIYDQTYKFMLPGDFLAMKLSGEINSTISGMSEGVFYNFKKEGVSGRLLDHFGFDKNIMPDLVPTFSDQSQLSGTAASELGLVKGVKITYRAGDQPNNALSLNVLNPGEIAATAGTSGVVYGVSDSLKSDVHSRVNTFAHVNHSAESRRLGVLLCINGTGIMYSWLHKNFSFSSYDEMNKLAQTTAIGSDGLLVFPFGNGSERMLKNLNPGARITNLQLTRHNQRHVVRAVKEGIAFSFRYGLDIMKEMQISPKAIRAGHANMFQSSVFREAIANLADSEIELFKTDGSEGAARGAGIGLGYYNFKEAFTGLKKMESVSPKTIVQDQYEEAYGRWKGELEKSIGF